MIMIKKVNDNKKGMKDFIGFPYGLYKNDRNWCPPLRVEMKKFFSNKNPFMRHGRVAYFVAYDGARPVGRVTAHIDELYNRHHNTRHAFFGFYESIENPEVCEKLMQSAENWANANKMVSILGPLNFNTKQELGFLIEGFEEPNFLMMTYTKEYYPDLLYRFGYRKEKELVSFRISNVLKIPEKIARSAKRLSDTYGDSVKIVTFNRHDLRDDHAFIRDVYNDAWSKNWRFIPITEEEIDNYIKELTQFMYDEFFYKIYMNGEPAALMLNVPNINEVLIKIRNGRLFPTGIFKLLYNRRRIKSAIVVIMGVRSKFRKLGLEVLLYHRLFEDHLANPRLNCIETTWILEDNVPMIKSLQNLNADLNKRYVILKKKLRE